MFFFGWSMVFFPEICQTCSELFLVSGLHTLSRLRQPCLQVASWLQIDVVLSSSFSVPTQLFQFLDWLNVEWNAECRLHVLFVFGFTSRVTVLWLYIRCQCVFVLLWIPKSPTPRSESNGWFYDGWRWSTTLISWPLTCTSLFLALWKDMIRMATDDQRD